MAALDENALICDFAETYHIFDWRTLPARLAATLAAGLRPNSRIMLKLANIPEPTENLLLAIIADAVRILAWQNTQDGRKGKNPPKSLFDAINKTAAPTEKASVGFDTPADFMSWREKMLNGGEASGN